MSGSFFRATPLLGRLAKHNHALGSSPSYGTADWLASLSAATNQVASSPASDQENISSSVDQCNGNHLGFRLDGITSTPEHVYWSPDEAKVGVLGTGLAIFSVACNTATGTPIPFEKIREDFGKSIRATYYVPPKEDPIQWAAMVDAQVEFFKLHPEIRLSYH